MKLRCLLLGRKAMTNLDNILKSRDITLPAKVHLVKAMVYSSSHVWIWELDHKEGWAPKNWCFWTVVLEKTLERPLDYKEIQPANPKGNQSWIFIGRTDAEAESPILWSPDAGKDRRWEEKGTTEDEMVGWHHWFNGTCLNKLQEMMKDREAWRAAVHGGTESRPQLSDWTTTCDRCWWLCPKFFLWNSRYAGLIEVEHSLSKDFCCEEQRAGMGTKASFKTKL